MTNPGLRTDDTTMQLTINGTPHDITDATTVTELLAALSLDPRAVVVELNRTIIRRPVLAATPIQHGDVVEIVHFVGGG